MSEHGLAPTTHATELRQFDEMNNALRTRRGLTAAVLELPAGVPPSAVLRTLRPTGPPSFRNVHGVFARPDGAGDLVIELHTAQLAGHQRQAHAAPAHLGRLSRGLHHLR